MTEALNELAMRVGTNTVAATNAMTSAIALTCNSIADLAEGSDQLGMPEIGSGKEVLEMVGALGSMIAARASQVAGRVALLRRAQKLGVGLAYGENCFCLGAAEGKSVSAEAAPLALA